VVRRLSAAPPNDRRPHPPLGSPSHLRANRRFDLLAAGVLVVRSTAMDALPDLSDVQVNPHPLCGPGAADRREPGHLSARHHHALRARCKDRAGYSFFGDSFVYVLFEGGTDLYWARSRVLEYLNQVQSRLPQGAKPSLGPDATGVDWVYGYVLVDRTGQHDLSQLRSLQDWFLRYELKTLPGVSEVASIGGMVKQDQVVLDPVKVVAAIQTANSATGGSVLELGEAEYVVRATGYLKMLDDFRAIPLKTAPSGLKVRLGDVATIQIGPEMRRGVAEPNSQGEVAGGMVILRSGENARESIDAVKAKLADLMKSLPPGVEIVPTYDRSQLNDRSAICAKN
jgi:Cu(I)/Ag(I) efflux system membrane protein CusA/SilA